MVQENQTFVCSVLFLDIVAYSKQPVADQQRVKQRFNELLSEALQNVSVNGRIILDTGDGAAISFPGNPEDALFVALELRDKLKLDDAKEFDIRFGINLGPVRMVTDINQQSNIIGNGINVAQRIMDFAEPGQILVSRSYYEVTACLSSDYEQLFKYDGARTDKHVHEHQVYVVGKMDPNQPTALRIKSAQNSSSTPGLSESAILIWERLRANLLRRSRGRLPVILSLAFVFIFSSIFAVRAALQQPSELANVEEIAEGDQLLAGLAGEAGEEPDASIPIADAAANDLAQADTKGGTVTASVRVSITPWGEVFVDGDKQGVCSPICELTLAAGTRRIEVHNPSASPRQEVITLKPGAKETLSYKF